MTFIFLLFKSEVAFIVTEVKLLSIFSCDSDEIQNHFSGSRKATLSEFHYSISIVAKNDSKKSKSCYEIMKTQKKP